MVFVMKIRKLLIVDAPLMLEWMHDVYVVHDMKRDFADMTIKDCEAFIQSASDSPKNTHLAIADDNNTYMGTVSLKHIDNDTAEFGIVIRKCAMGLGYSKFGMDFILDEGFNQRRLKKIYWCVLPRNIRAIKFYDKNGFNRSAPPKEAKLHYEENEINDYIWYCIVNN